MTITDHQAKYLAHELTRRFPSGSDARLAGALVDAQVDLNPHQVDAALFAFNSPLSKGALLADEVGLGKTIEAGLVILQRWAERKRRILVVTPANLRKQWHQELTEKFALPCRILDAKSFNDAVKLARPPFDDPTHVLICSYQFARSKETDVSRTPWDLAVFDEAHRLRNVYKPSNVIANSLKRALGRTHKLLLTATPLQNSILELYGLVTFIDEHAFGDVNSFREQFASLGDDRRFRSLKTRLAPLCHRTLRRQVTQYIAYTQRRPILQPFSPEESEDRLYHLVSEYLQRDNLQALPKGQRSLLTLVLRKLLASSTFAIAGALQTIVDRLKQQVGDDAAGDGLTETLDRDYEALDETEEEWGEDEGRAPLPPDVRAAIAQEIADLEAFATLARGIEHNAKGKALLTALDIAFAQLRELGARDKAIIFTESRRTQDYLQRVLADAGYGEDVVLFNGSNTDDRSRAIYAAWLAQHEGTDKVTGAKAADMRSALVDWFREQGRIMIATEAGAEGINLQFCSLVVNYDLPWNPQRIEQRIGRCHRYGQKHDVVVVNFLNSKNAADQRVYELLDEKFRLFDGIFGASDEVLGAIESGVEFEKRIAAIYQTCRHPEEIRKAFDSLQLELSLEITEAMTDTRRKLLEHFDEEVRERLRMRNESSVAQRDRFEDMLMTLTRHELGERATHLGDGVFDLEDAPSGSISAGRYELPRRSGEAHLYRLGSPLAEWVVEQAKARELYPAAAISFRYDPRQGRISAVEGMVGKSGWLLASLLSVESLDRAEDHMMFAARVDDGTRLDVDALGRMLRLDASVSGPCDIPPDVAAALSADEARRQADVQLDISTRNAQFLDAESTKLDDWADDLKLGLEREIKELERQIKEVRKGATAALTLEDKLAARKRVQAIESSRNEKRKRLFEAQDEIEQRRDALLADVEARLDQSSRLERLFTIRWTVTA
ncbi:MAG: DEAD/DEAH box helicase family protein [Gemmatimonadaceae bacterium]|nr:DEAD/DEAH box helicase family protein [Gemmatimonadaceae bacterium]